MNYKPVIKWIGGKTQIINDLFKYFPIKINNYYEPFIGGGSVFLKLLEKIENKEIELSGKIYLSDKNKELINLYNTIKNNPKELIEKLTELKTTYKSSQLKEHTKGMKYKVVDNVMKSTSNKYYIARYSQIEDIIQQGKRVVYYFYRDLFNSTNNKILQASLFIFLNKTCFRGLYRIGPNGFNSAYGNNKNVTIFAEEYILTLSNLFNKYNIIFEEKSFDDIKVEQFNSEDFFYFDPPYYPINKKSFVAYQKEGFGEDLNKKLFKLCNYLNENDIKFVQSNSDAEYINETYGIFAIDKILCKRAINSKSPDSKVLEVIIRN